MQKGGGGGGGNGGGVKVDASGKAEKFCCEWMSEKKVWKKKKSTGTLNPGVQMQVGVGRELGDTVEGLSLINKTVLVVKAFIMEYA